VIRTGTGLHRPPSKITERARRAHTPDAAHRPILAKGRDRAMLAGSAPPGAHRSATEGGRHMAEQARRIEVDRADRAVIGRAAARLRADAIAAGYAGLPRKDLAFAVALVLDELARHVRDLDGA
jgi:hypothetical protein